MSVFTMQLMLCAILCGDSPDGLVPASATGNAAVGIVGGVGHAPPVQPTVRITNFVPAFLAFHDEARRLETELRDAAAQRDQEVDPVEISRVRREAWDRHLAEMAPRVSRQGAGEWTPEGLDAAWDRYDGTMDRIRSMVDGVTPAPQGVFQEVASRLRLDRSLEVEVILYVGTFQEHPAFRLVDGQYAILLPVETLPQARRPLFMDLFTRAVHARLSGRPADGRLSMAKHLFLRGLALRVYEDATPGRPAESYLLRSRDWLLAAERRDREILDGMRGRLGERDPEVLARFVEGSRAGGDFEYAAWRISGLLLMDGWSLDRLARIPVDEVPAVVAEVMDSR